MKSRTSAGGGRKSPISARLGGFTRQAGVGKRRGGGAAPHWSPERARPAAGARKKPRARMERLLDRLRSEVSLLTDRGTRMSEQVRQLYTNFEKVIRVVSPAAVKRGNTADQNTEDSPKTTLSNFEESLEDSLLDNTLIGEADVVDLSQESVDIGESVLEPLPADFSLDTSRLQDVSIDCGIKVLELPASLNKSVDSEGRHRDKPISFSKIKKIDKCSTGKWPSMNSPRARRRSPFPRGRAKRRLSDEFDLQVSSSKSKNVARKIIADALNGKVVSQSHVPPQVTNSKMAPFQDDANMKGMKESRNSVHGAIREEEIDHILHRDATDAWYVTLDDPHIYENIMPSREMNVDAASPAKSTTSDHSFSSKDSKMDSAHTPKTGTSPDEEKLTAVKKSMEKIIKDLRSPACGLTRTDSRCSTLKLGRSHSADDLLDTARPRNSTDRSVYETVDLPTPLWGQVSPPRCPNPSSPETIRRCLFTMPRNFTPLPFGEVSSTDTVAWGTSFDTSLPLTSSSRTQKAVSGATFSRPSAFRPYSKTEDKPTTSVKEEGKDEKKKFFESLILSNNCQYICMDKSARANVLKSVSKRLFETPTLDDMQPVEIPDLMPKTVNVGKWFSTPKLDDMEPVVIPEFSNGDASMDHDLDDTLVASSPSPQSNTSSDSGRGSCSSVTPSEPASHSSSGISLKSPGSAEESVNEPIYETIAETDTYAGLDELTFDLGRSSVEDVSPAEHTYARIDETLSPEPPALPERPVEYNLFERMDQERKVSSKPNTENNKAPDYAKVNKCKHCSSCTNCNQKPAAKPQRALHPDEMVKKTDIVDMNAFHMYTVADVLESMERLAGNIPENSAPRGKARQSLYGLISDQKTRREISQALALETKLKSNAPSGIEKYRPNKSRETVAKQPLKPIENIYNQHLQSANQSRMPQPKPVQRSQPAEVIPSKKTMPINQVSRIACVKTTDSSESIPKENSMQVQHQHHVTDQQPVIGRAAQKHHAFQKGAPFRRSMGSIPPTRSMQLRHMQRPQQQQQQQQQHQQQQVRKNKQRPVSMFSERAQSIIEPVGDDHLYCNIEEMRLQAQRVQQQQRGQNGHHQAQNGQKVHQQPQSGHIVHPQTQNGHRMQQQQTQNGHRMQQQQTQNGHKVQQQSQNGHRVQHQQSQNGYQQHHGNPQRHSQAHSSHQHPAQPSVRAQGHRTSSQTECGRPAATVFVRENPKVARVDMPPQQDCRRSSQSSIETMTLTRRDLFNRSLLSTRPSSTLDTTFTAGQTSSKHNYTGPFRRTRSAMQLEWKGMNTAGEIYC